MKRGAVLFIAPLFLAMGFSASSAETEVSGKIDVQARYYLEKGEYVGQDYHEQGSIGLQPEFYWEFNNGDDSIIFKPFYRHDQQDDERSHGDIRELLWTKVGSDWELKAGIGKVFWGVTEFQHLVDSINQTDGVESFDGEEKLGQPMVNLTFIRDWGVLDAFVLPGFRERTFAGKNGRLRPPVHVDSDSGTFESSDETSHVDYALRWSHSVDVFDLGLHWFRGTNRDPLLNLRSDNGETYFSPHYEQMVQVGVDVQATVEEWLWKFEAISRNGQFETYTAVQAGFEYSFYGVADSDTDVGVLLEYGWDDRGKEANAGFQNDIFLGSRFTFNNVESTELLIGGGYDLDYDSYSFLIEGSHRLTNNFKMVIDARIFDSEEPKDLTYAIRQDDYVQFTLEYYF